MYHNYSNISSPVDCCHDAFLRRCSDGHSAAAVDIGNDPAPVATADAFDMGAPAHRWGRSCSKLAAPARSSGILSSEADSPWLAMGGCGNCLKRSCTSGEVTRRVGPEENANLGDRSLDSRCAAGGTNGYRSVCVQEPCHIFPFFSIGSSQVDLHKWAIAHCHTDEIRKAIPPVARLLQSSTFFLVSRRCHSCSSLSTTDKLKPNTNI